MEMTDLSRGASTHFKGYQCNSCSKNPLEVYSFNQLSPELHGKGDGFGKLALSAFVTDGEKSLLIFPKRSD